MYLWPCAVPYKKPEVGVCPFPFGSGNLLLSLGNNAFPEPYPACHQILSSLHSCLLLHPATLPSMESYCSSLGLHRMTAWQGEQRGRESLIPEWDASSSISLAKAKSRLKSKSTWEAWEATQRKHWPRSYRTFQNKLRSRIEITNGVSPKD